jgi:predicted TPR repeat methyltransferase
MRTAHPTPATPDPAHLERRIREMLASGRIHAARPLIGALRRLAPPAARLAEIEARALLAEGRLDAALAELDAGVAREPEAVALRMCRSEARMMAQDTTGAAADAAEAVILDARNPQAKALLGVVLVELGRNEDAVACLREAVAAEPARPPFLKGLALAQERNGDPAGAAATLAAAIERVPGDVSLRTAAIMVAMRQRGFDRAAALALSARRDGVADACVFGLHGHALASLGRHNEANDAYAEALKLAPEDPYVRHLVAAAGLLPQATRAPSEYLEAVFDGYATRFDTHLIGLGYRVPGLMRAALLERFPRLAAGDPVGPILDLGCGTGLVAVVLSDLPSGPLTGVDVSDGMLAQARAKGLYHRLEQADLETFLARDTGTWPVIVAADVFCYLGVLDEVLRLAHARLSPGGILAFTVEALDEAGTPGWRLGRQGRFMHAIDYVRAAAEAAGFAVRTARREALRFEAEAEVPGLLFVLERVRHDG